MRLFEFEFRQALKMCMMFGNGKLNYSGQGSRGCLPVAFFNLGDIPARIGKKLIKLNLETHSTEIHPVMWKFHIPVSIFVAWKPHSQVRKSILKSFQMYLHSFSKHLITICTWYSTKIDHIKQKETRLAMRKGLRSLPTKWDVETLSTIGNKNKTTLNKWNEGREIE